METKGCEKMEKKYSRTDLIVAYFQKKSQLYRKQGYRMATFLNRNREDYDAHFFAFLMDVNVCLLPVYIWVIEFLLILCGLISPYFFDLLFYIMYAFLFIVSALGLGFVTSRTHGQSFGYFMSDLKLVGSDKKEAPPLNLMMRQVFGMGIPIMVLGFVFGTVGIMVWWLLNGICVLATPHQQTIFDLVFRLVTVREPEQDIHFEAQEVQEVPVMPIDLHIRSNYSDDGYYDVEEIFKQAKQLNMEVISITDHNCARANATAMRFSRLYDIDYIPGVEIDAQFESHRVRVLGYYIDWGNEIFNQVERMSLTREKQVSIERVKKFESYSGIAIDVDSLMSNSRFQTITASDITSMVFHNERVRQLPFVKKYIDRFASENEAMKAFKHDMFDKNGPCYVRALYPPLSEMLDAIHEADGIAILSGWNLKDVDEAMLQKMMDLGLDGIECFSPDVDQETMARLLKVSQANKAFISSGSDYHGPTKPNRHLGKTYCPEKGLPLVRILTRALSQ